MQFFLYEIVARVVANLFVRLLLPQNKEWLCREKNRVHSMVIFWTGDDFRPLRAGLL